MITVWICAAFVVGAVTSRALDRIEEFLQSRRDDRRYAARFRAKASVVNESFAAGRDGEK